ncbi:MAG: PEP-CTERM sorting domain-containing protein [Planctomycetota bacterium]
MRRVSLLSAALSIGAFTLPAAASPITFGQLNEDGSTGSGDFGQTFVLTADDGFTAPSFTLDAATFFRGSAAGGSDTLFLDVYVNSGADESATFTASGAPAGVTYLGSSANSNNHDTAELGDALDYTFSGIEILPGTIYYLVFSSDAVEGNLVGTSTQQFQATTGFNYSNIDPLNTNPLLAGNEAGDIGLPSDGANEHRFTATVTAVPEPGSMALIALGGGLMLVRRR